MERNYRRFTSGLNCAVFVGAVLLAGLDTVKVKAIEVPDGKDICQGIRDPTAQKQCRSTLRSLPDSSNTAGVTLIEGWRLVRTPRPEGGEVSSVSHLADMQKSDSNFAGILLGCGRTAIELSMVVIEPYPPNISVDLVLRLSNGTSSNYRGSIIAPGVMVRLPSEAIDSVLNRHQQSDELTVTLAHGSAPSTTGVVKLAGLEQAVSTLKALCSRP